MWYLNEEWIFPIVKDGGLKGVIFLDAGNAFEKSENWDIGDLRTSAGLGFRWLSPMGPLRLEWGYNLHPRDDEDSSVWDFSIGGAF
jgi:outer membrane protein insertion porin family